MNYLSHYYCDYPESRPYYILGTILPDLVREIQKKKVRFVADELQHAENEIAEQLNAGICRHLEIDVLFHQSTFFHEKCALIKNWMRKHQYSSISRLHIFAHVLLELMIDRVIINKNRKVMTDFYNALDIVEKQPIIDYFTSNGIISRPEAVFHRVQYFCKDRFLFRYPDNDMMIYALNVLNQKVGNSVILKEDEMRLLETIHLTEEDLMSDKLTIFDELRP
ncbi:MAG: hypothetical protein ACI959_001326 [Limisphaerales bacterium]